jgi:protein involved in polysaccharide export with SLBB domain
VSSRTITRAVFLNLIILLLAAVPLPAEEGKPAQEILETLYTLGSGDRLKITVFGEAQLSGEFQVDGGGRITFPLISEVGARGLTIRDLTAELTALLRDGYLIDPKITLEVLNYRPFYILGEVRQPGKYEYLSGITLYNAIALAGGYTHRARQNRAEITRANPERVLTDADHGTVILPGDIINIRERFF